MSPGKCKVKQWDSTIHLLEWPKSVTWHQVLKTRNTIGILTYYCWELWFSHFDVFVFVFVFNKIKHVLTMQFSSSIPWHLPKGVINICPHKSLYMDVYWNFIHNCQNLGSTKMFFSKWADKPWCIPDSGILFSAKRKWAVKHWRDMEEP